MKRTPQEIYFCHQLISYYDFVSEAKKEKNILQIGV